MCVKKFDETDISEISVEYISLYRRKNILDLDFLCDNCIIHLYFNI